MVGELPRSTAWTQVGGPVRSSRLVLPFYLALKEVQRNKGRFGLIAAVIALITILVLFIAALAEGLGNGNKEYIEKLDAGLLVYQSNVDISIPSSRIEEGRLRGVRRVPGVREAGGIGFSNGALVFEDGRDALKVSLIGVQPGQPGEPAVVSGAGLRGDDEREAIIDRYVALRTGLQTGDRLTFKTTQNTQEEFYELEIVGVADGQQYSIQPSVIVPYRTWERIRPQERVPDEPEEVIFNVIAVKLDGSTPESAVSEGITARVRNVEVVDLTTAYEATPGYSAQQSTLNTQRFFSLLIGVLVVGGFFQIQTLQKVAQIGMLKAIGASNTMIAAAFVIQIVAVTCLGVALGGVGAYLLSLALPPVIPITFTWPAVGSAVGSLLLIGPIGGLVSVRALLKVEPLTALGLQG